MLHRKLQHQVNIQTLNIMCTKNSMLLLLLLPVRHHTFTHIHTHSPLAPPSTITLQLVPMIMHLFQLTLSTSLYMKVTATCTRNQYQHMLDPIVVVNLLPRRTMLHQLMGILMLQSIQFHPLSNQLEMVPVTNQKLRNLLQHTPL